MSKCSIHQNWMLRQMGFHIFQSHHLDPIFGIPFRSTKSRWTNIKSSIPMKLCAFPGIRKFIPSILVQNKRHDDVPAIAAMAWSMPPWAFQRFWKCAMRVQRGGAFLLQLGQRSGSLWELKMGKMSNFFQHFLDCEMNMEYYGITIPKNSNFFQEVSMVIVISWKKKGMISLKWRVFSSQEKWRVGTDSIRCDDISKTDWPILIISIWYPQWPQSKKRTFWNWTT